MAGRDRDIGPKQRYCLWGLLSCFCIYLFNIKHIWPEAYLNLWAKLCTLFQCKRPDVGICVCLCLCVSLCDGIQHMDRMCKSQHAPAAMGLHRAEWASWQLGSYREDLEWKGKVPLKHLFKSNLLHLLRNQFPRMICSESMEGAMKKQMLVIVPL